MICHGVPDQRPLEDGDILNLDVSCYYKGFHGDSNGTYLVGNVDEVGRKLVQVTKECLDLAIAAGKGKKKNASIVVMDIGRVWDSLLCFYMYSETWCSLS